MFFQSSSMGSGHKTLLYGNAILLRHSNSNMVSKQNQNEKSSVRIFDICYFQYLACLSSSSSSDKLAFDVGLQEQSDGKEGTLIITSIN